MDRAQMEEAAKVVFSNDSGWSPLSWLLEGETTFIFSLIVGCCTILVWSIQRFNEPAFALSKLRGGLELRPSDIFEGMHYARGWAVFYLLLLFGYFFMVFMGPSFAGLFGMSKSSVPDQDKATFPLLLLAFFINILPSTPKLSEAERYIRAMGQKALGFPQDITALRNALIEARLNAKILERYIAREIRANDPDSGHGFNDKPLCYLVEDDFKEKRVKALSDWRRCCILLWLCRRWHGELLRGHSRMAQVYAVLSQELDNLSKDVKAYRESLGAKKAGEAARDRREASRDVDENVLVDDALIGRMRTLHEEIALLCITLSFRLEQSVPATIRPFEQVGFTFPARSMPLDFKNLVVCLLLWLSVVGIMSWYAWWFILANIDPANMGAVIADLRMHEVPTLTTGEKPWLVVLAITTAVAIATASLSAVGVRRWRIESKVWNSQPYDYVVVAIFSALLSLTALISTDIIVKAIVGPAQGSVSEPVQPRKPMGEVVVRPSTRSSTASLPAPAGNSTRVAGSLQDNDKSHKLHWDGLVGYLPYGIVYAVIGFICAAAQGGNMGGHLLTRAVRLGLCVVGGGFLVAGTTLWLDLTVQGSPVGAYLPHMKIAWGMTPTTTEGLIRSISACYSVLTAMLGAVSAVVACMVVAYLTKRDIADSPEVERLVADIEAAHAEQTKKNGWQRDRANFRKAVKSEYRNWILTANKDICNLTPAEASRFTNRHSEISAAIAAFVQKLTERQEINLPVQPSSDPAGQADEEALPNLREAASRIMEADRR